jgi:hypothetical protein
MKLIVNQIEIAVAAAKGSVRMSAEKIKQLLIRRKNILARLKKVKRPTEKTKARVAKNTAHIATLTTKLKTAVKQEHKAGKKPTPSAAAGKTKIKKERPQAFTAPGEAKVGKKSSTGNPDLDLVMKRVDKARKNYIKARLTKGVSPAKLESIKHRYESAFKSYTDLKKEASHSSTARFAHSSGSSNPLPGHYDPIVLAYNHIMNLNLKSKINVSTSRASIDSIVDPKMLAKLSTTKNADIRQAVAENRHTSPDILAKLAQDSDSVVAIAAITNPKYRN